MKASLDLLLDAAFPNKTDGVAIDIGAHFGKFTKHLAEIGKFSVIYAFEPNHNNVIYIKNEIESIVNSEVILINKALGSSRGMAELFFDDDSSTGSLLAYGAQYKNIGDIKKSVVDIDTLDAFIDEEVKKRKIDVTFIKIDTQGNDLEVIRGAEKLIHMHRPIIQCELIFVDLYVGQCTPDDIHDFLGSYGYRLYTMCNIHVNREGQLSFCDAIFVPCEINIPETQEFSCIDDAQSFQDQINALSKVCEERLELIHRLDAEITRLTKFNRLGIKISTYFDRKLKAIKTFL